MINKACVLLLSSDHYLASSLIYAMTDIAEVHFMHKAPPSKIMTYILSQYYDVIFVDKRFERIDEIICIIKSGHIDTLSSLVLFSFSQNNNLFQQSLFNKNIDMSLPFDVVCYELANFIKKVISEHDRKPFKLQVRWRILSLREKAVMDFLTSGRTIYDAAKSFNCSTKTIHTHKYNALKKLGFKNIRDYLIFKNIVNFMMESNTST
ncbi:hypothetical protein H8I69_21385 [Serratia fonticola]|uniref:LuxR C-terminal-related transcriptional regulator n=1 Tax=Serratia fonticola TaxID=47917 RepID=UPI0015C5F03F|nr:helix-turn-helix transcriptional regulator [Serratia fonticola]MBC3381671.1 hypothetical protein [Serratia fonticola]NYA40870.1 hypothetical protein [Serratia fonticola]